MAWTSTDVITRLPLRLDPPPPSYGGGKRWGKATPRLRLFPSVGVRRRHLPRVTGEGYLRRRREVQLDADAVGIVEEDLLAAGARDHLLAELHLLGLELAAHAGDVGCGEGDVVEAAGVLELL